MYQAGVIGPITTGLWSNAGRLLSIDGGDPPPLTPGSLFAEAYVTAIFSSSSEKDGEEFGRFLPRELTSVIPEIGPEQTEIGVAGPSIYVSDERPRSQPGDEFQLTTTNNADATVVNDSLSGDGQLRFEVFRCNTARAELPLGEVDSTLSLSFDFESRRNDSFWEIPYARVIEDGSIVVDIRMAPNQGNNPKTGRIDESIDVDGDVSVEFGIEPSRFCSNFDHADTFLTISALDVSTSA
jgi:hypothetical protein